MKKIILGCALLCGCLTFAQTATPTTSIPTTSTGSTQAQTAMPSKVDGSALEGIARNIDRRLIYFNRYVQNKDIESLKKLVSEENKDFYTNFIKYLESAPVFSLKRDMTTNIVKTPTDEYAVVAVMTLDGKEKKVSMTFIEEKAEQGTKWLIYNSNLHIQVPVGRINTNLGSSAIKKDTEIQTPPTKTQTSLPSNQTGKNPSTDPANIPSKTGPSLPVIKNDPQTDSPKQVKTAGKSMNMTTIIFISIASIVMIESVAGYYLVCKKKNKKIAAVSIASSAVASSANTVVSSISTPGEISPSHNSSLMPSNVNISSVEEIHGISSSLAEDERVPSNITIIQDKFEDITPIKNETIITAPASAEKSADSTPPELNTGHEGIVSPVKTALTQTDTLAEDISSKSTETQEVSSPSSSIAPENISNTVVENSTEHNSATPETSVASAADTPVENMQPHALFDGIFDSAPGEKNNQSPITTVS